VRLCGTQKFIWVQIMEKCRILIPGGAGFVGWNLVRVLHSENYDMHEVTVLDNDRSNLAFVKRYGVQTQRVDLAEKGSCVTN